MATSMTATSRFLLVGALAAVCLSLQGCAVLEAPRHSIGNWQQKENYLTKFEVAPLNGNGGNATLNSCNNKAVNAGLKCTGHGTCKEWVDITIGDVQKQRLSFCDCDKNFADPECGTERKSQLTAFILSIVLGWFGIDQFYLGFMWYGFFKLISFGGLGLWYVYDLVRIGSNDVLTVDKFRVANDLPHGAFVLMLIIVMGFLGFALSVFSIYRERKSKGREVLLYRADEEAMKRLPDGQPATMGPMTYFSRGPSFASQATGGSRNPSYVPAVQHISQPGTPVISRQASFRGYGTTIG